MAALFAENRAWIVIIHCVVEVWTLTFRKSDSRLDCCDPLRTTTLNFDLSKIWFALGLSSSIAYYNFELLTFRKSDSRLDCYDPLRITTLNFDLPKIWWHEMYTHIVMQLYTNCYQHLFVQFWPLSRHQISRRTVFHERGRKGSNVCLPPVADFFSSPIENRTTRNA